MNIEEIQQAITRLSPNELARFRVWFKEYESNLISIEPNDSKQPIEHILKRLKGSLKGSGALEALVEEHRKESLL